MELEQILNIKDKIKNRIRSGDFRMLSEVLNISYGCANARYKRNDEITVRKMQEIVKGREELTENLKA